MHNCSKCVYFRNFSGNFVKSGLCYCDIDMQKKMNTRGHARYVLGALPCLCPKARKEQQARDNARRSAMLAVEASARLLLKTCREYVFPSGELLSDREPDAQGDPHSAGSGFTSSEEKCYTLEQTAERSKS